MEALFCAKLQTLEKAKVEDPTITHLRGGLGLQLKKKNIYFNMPCSESVKRWHETWFYYFNVPDPTGAKGLPQYIVGSVVKQPWWNTRVTKQEMECAHEED